MANNNNKIRIISKQEYLGKNVNVLSYDQYVKNKADKKQKDETHQKYLKTLYAESRDRLEKYRKQQENIEKTNRYMTRIRTCCRRRSARIRASIRICPT